MCYMKNGKNKQRNYFILKKYKIKNEKIICLALCTILICLILYCLVNNKENLYISIGGTFIGIIGAFLVYQISLSIKAMQQGDIKLKNTKFIYQLYKIELEMNRNHINDFMRFNTPFFRLKTITRDRLWGELANYSKDIKLMEKLNHAYGEFELINNKIDLMNAARMANIEKSTKDKSKYLEVEILEQNNGCIGLGKKVLPAIAECLDVLSKTMENL